MIAIPSIRRDLTSDLLGRHIYLFGPGSVTTEILRRLAEAGAAGGDRRALRDRGNAGQRGGALSTASGRRRRAAVRGVATLALADAIGHDDLAVTPKWPDQVIVDGVLAAHSVVQTAPAGERTSYVILGADIDVRALEAMASGPIDWNIVIAAFLNALDKWATAYAARGPAAVRGAIRFLPRAPVARNLEARNAG